jgi:hypothetical protein
MKSINMNMVFLSLTAFALGVAAMANYEKYARPIECTKAAISTGINIIDHFKSK